MRYSPEILCRLNGKLSEVISLLEDNGFKPDQRMDDLTPKKDRNSYIINLFCQELNDHFKDYPVGYLDTKGSEDEPTTLFSTNEDIPEIRRHHERLRELLNNFHSH